MKKAVLFSAVALVAITVLFAQSGKVFADHKEMQDHYNACTKAINDLRIASRTVSEGTNHILAKHKQKVLNDLNNATTSLMAYRQDLEKEDAQIIRQDLREK